jgi:Icc-related predicted phosphoesterase
MKVVHLSDWHGKAFDLPEADVYFITGDMLPNFRPHVIEVEGGSKVEWQPNMEMIGPVTAPKPAGVTMALRLDHGHEARMQTLYLKHNGLGYLRCRMKSPQAPVVVCRGNHDFVSIAPMVLGGDSSFGPVYEVSNDPTRTFDVAGLKVGGFRGMTKHRGRWSDEFSEDEFSRRADLLPKDLDILVTHNPPCGIRDRMPAKDGTDQWISLGSPALLDYHMQRKHTLRAHLFGHIHESYGTYHAQGTVYSNAATSFNVIDL